MPVPFSDRFRRWLSRKQPPEAGALVVAALVVGVTSAAGVWLFKQLFNLLHLAAFNGLGGALQPLGPWTIALIPAAGGLVVGIIRHFLIGHEEYHGVPGVMEVVALAGGRLPYRLLPAKTIAAALSIGFGASVGPEDPSVQIGANLASMFGQWLRLSDERMRTLVAAGTAAGIAAAFNAPIAGVFFALEIVLGELSGGAFSAVVLAAVVSAIFTQAVSGPQPAFRVPPYQFSSITELPFYLVLGLLAGPVAALYIKTLYGCKDLLAKWHLPGWLETAAAGLAVGITGAFLPRVFGVGYDTIGNIFGGQNFPLLLLLALLAAKLVMTSVSISGGFVGGLFAPSLFLGAVLGAAFGEAARATLPSLQINPAAFAMVGMAAVLAGAVHAPLTAIILLFEMTNDYRIILPLMAAVIVSMVTAQRLQPDSIYTVALARKGLRLQRGRDLELLQGITVGDVMRPEEAVVPEMATLGEVNDLFMRTRRHGLPVLDAAGDLAGIITVSDVERAHAANLDLATPIGQVCTREVLVTYPDETIGAALRRMSAVDVGRLPVVARNDPRRLVGILRRNDLVRAYNLALSRRASARHRAEQARLQTLAGSNRVSVEELVVEAGSLADGKRINEIPWPQDSMIATVRRGQQIIIPHGDTRLEAADALVAVAEGQARERLREICADRAALPQDGPQRPNSANPSASASRNSTTTPG